MTFEIPLNDKAYSCLLNLFMNISRLKYFINTPTDKLREKC